MIAERLALILDKRELHLHLCECITEYIIEDRTELLQEARNRFEVRWLAQTSKHTSAERIAIARRAMFACLVWAASDAGKVNGGYGALKLDRNVLRQSFSTATSGSTGEEGENRSPYRSLSPES